MAAVAPMDIEETKYDPTSIPLKCTICPKQPIFSDVSHLLTHCSSKSHLAYRFKTELRSGKDEESREILEKYLRWEHASGIRDLLVERLDAKENKKPAKRGRPAGTGVSGHCVPTNPPSRGKPLNNNPPTEQTQGFPESGRLGQKRAGWRAAGPHPRGDPLDY